MHIAAYNNSYGVAAILLDHEADVELTDVSCSLLDPGWRYRA